MQESGNPNLRTTRELVIATAVTLAQHIQHQSEQQDAKGKDAQALAERVRQLERTSDRYQGALHLLWSVLSLVGLGGIIAILKAFGAI